MMQKLWNYKLTRFLVIGICNTLLDFILLNTMVFVLGFTVLLANTVSVCIGVTISYFLNHHIVFKKKHNPTVNIYLQFFLVTGLSIVIIQGITISLTSPLYTHIFNAIKVNVLPVYLSKYEQKITLNLSKATAVVVGMVWNYLLYNKFIFVEKTAETNS